MSFPPAIHPTPGPDMATWSWNGARWWKFDFHAHSPASDDYGKGPSQVTLKTRTTREWLLDYMRAGIDCVAITDHNSGAWIDRLKSALAELDSEKPSGYRPLVLFPGVEISVHGGIHVLAVFAPDKTTSDIDSLLGAVDFRGTKGSSANHTECAFPQVIEAIDRAGGLAIPAHVDCDNGLFTRFQGATLGQALECDAIVAMELTDPRAPKPQVYVDRKLAWSEIVGSDSHHPAGNAGQRYPGSHFTWIKMGTPSLEGLRLALLDGRLSVRRSDETSADPNSHASLVIESIEVSQARYMGRARPFNVSLNPWLNALIGGRGTGKSTLVEFLRLALRREKELPKTLEEDFKKYWTLYLTRDDEGLLTDATRIVVAYRKDGTRYRVQWSQRGDLEPIQVEEGANVWRADHGDVAQRFPIRIYSQKQIFEMARAPLALLRIMDEAAEVDRRGWDDRWKEEESKFLSLRAKAREIETSLGDEPRLRGELEDIKRKLAVFEQAGHANVLKEYQKRLRQQRVVEEWEKSWTRSGQRVRDLAADIAPAGLEPSLFEGESPEDRGLLEKAQVPLDRLEAVRQRLADLARELDQVLAEWNRERDTSAWKQAVGAAVAQYESLRKTLADQRAGDPSAYGDLVQRRQAIEARLGDLGSRRRQLDSIRLDADASLSRLRDLRRELTTRRTNFLAQVLAANPYVRITVVPYGARDVVESEFRQLLQREGGGFEKDIGDVDGEGLLGDLYRGQPASAEMEQRLGVLRDKLRRIAAGKHSATELRDQRFASHVAKLPPEAFDRLDLWFPEDSLRVEYSTTADGAGLRPIQEGSPGQKTAALLAFLLSYGEEPIVLDQPEEDLDNHLIYDLIVKQLRSIKQRRQTIVVTHNANIVVNGDAELVVALVAREGETDQECVGSLQERDVRDTICAVLEGGREAFEQRYRRIALEPGYV
jgi:energy-coupling factor transporter ATP-binding protein EcfA2